MPTILRPVTNGTLGETNQSTICQLMDPIYWIIGKELCYFGLHVAALHSVVRIRPDQDGAHEGFERQLGKSFVLNLIPQLQREVKMGCIRFV